MYSLDSRHAMRDLRILQYHLKTTLTKSSKDAATPTQHARGGAARQQPNGRSQRSRGVGAGGVGVGVGGVGVG
eukprot:420083-Prymnesium_polylepis.1